jgi:tetratricopeptide (TPR) repeat protein
MSFPKMPGLLNRLVRVIVFAGVFLGAVGQAPGQSLDDDVAFASGLIDWGFSDFATKLADSILVRHPEAADRVNLIRAQSLIAGRKFADAEAILAQLGTSPKADAVRLALANAYNATGDTDKARQIYNDFFGRFADTPADPDVLRFYRDAAYRYAIILERAGDLTGALAAYDRVVKTNPEKDILRRIQNDQAQILLKLARANHEGKRDEYAFRTRKLVEDIQWGGVDLWFGQSIITLANVELIYNDEAKAQQIIQDYMDILKQIDVLLEENGMGKALSPMAGARFMAGEIHQRAAERAAGDNNPDAAVPAYAKALGEFYNVFIQYPQSDVGPEAGVRAQAVKDILVNTYGRKVNIDLGDRVGEAAATQFRLAETLFREKKYSEAVNEYLRTINQFPETPATAKAFANLMLSYAHLDDPLMVRTLASYVAERLSGQPEAAIGLLAAGKYYVDAQKSDLFTELYETYLAGFPDHERVGTILFFLATQRKKAGDEAGAAAYFQRIIDNYPQDAFYPRALNQVAWSFYKAGDYEQAIAGFRKLVEETPPNPERANAQFNLADSLVRLERYAEAAVELETLIGWIAPRTNPYATTPADRERLDSLLERATFQRGLSFARLSEPADQIPDFRDRAIRAFDQFVKLFPASELAPRALSSKGTVQLELKQFEAASATFDELAAKFPQSPEGKNALFSLARAAMEIGQIDQGVAAFRRMMQQAAQYDAGEFVRLGQMMGEAGRAEEAIEAFTEVQRKVERLPESEREAQRPLIERALFGIAQAYYQAKRYPEAVQSVEELFARYPQSGLFYDAKFLQGEAYRDGGQLQSAVDALSDVFRFASDSALINRATMTLAEIQRSNGELIEALASYQRLALLADRTDPDTRPAIEEAMLASVEIGRELGRFADVVDYANDYIEVFPQGKHIETIRRLRGEALMQTAAP